MFSRSYRLSKSRSILKHCYRMYLKRKDRLPEDQVGTIKELLCNLDNAIVQEDRKLADQLARKLESIADLHFKKSPVEFFVELLIAISLALLIATVVRQSWFEPYEIPTGSMRPTFKEHDHVTVTKTAFGINVPLQTDHFYFDPDLVQRGGIVIFTSDGLDIPYTDTTYFWIFPSKKRYIKRLIGKPGDSLYFYGGQIYGVDKEGHPLTDFLDAPWMQKLDHVPFLSFNQTRSSDVSKDNQGFPFFQMHQEVGRILPNSQGKPVGQVYNGKQWVTDNPNAQKKKHNEIETYSDFFGMRNFAKARLLTKEELKEQPNINMTDLEDGVLYLQLNHTPSLNYPQPSIGRSGGRVRYFATPQTTVIPLQQRHLDAIMDNLYTSRFVVKNGRAKQYSAGNDKFSPGSPRMARVPDGTYEFYYGKPQSIDWLAIGHEIPKDSPLLARTPENVQRLFNMGIEFNTVYEPHADNQFLFPNRYAYFRNGDLYLMGAPVIKKEDDTLTKFLAREQKHEEASSASKPYIPFQDYGPPVVNGHYDVDFIRKFGLTVPEGSYFVLGDNHANSQDSRIFGFVPEENMQGAPSLLIYPPSDRWGFPNQKTYPFMNLPRMIVWTIAAIVLLVWYIIHRRNLKLPVIKDKKQL
ncbi:MAG: signal peptidase I [Chlamydiales bacterium]|nr:signal peptidase I [Chlamydiia bacterium]MCP5507660.1 signal peptidase I [Chlamydiales bacterium]